MNSGRRMPSAAAKRALLGGVAVACLMAAPALAQAPEATASQPSPPARGADGLAADEMYMEADQVSRNNDTKVTTAEGSVEIRYDSRTIRSNRLVYDENTGVIRAYGDIQIVNADGSVEFADQLTLDDKMKAGVAQGFSARLADNITIAAATAVRRTENTHELNRAIYTPCPLCADDNTSKKPTWSISADRVIQDRERRIVSYRNARIRVKGVPLIYLPVFWHADPQAGRSSGFLPPKMSGSDRRGFSYEQPYFWVTSRYSDLTLSPQFNSEVNPFLNTHYRQRFYSGDLDVRVGFTYDKDFDGQGRRFGEDTSRSYILSRGAFSINDKWRWGFTAERASDDLIFDKYEVSKVYETRGPYIADDRRLISQLYTVRQDERSYFSAAAFSIQGLRPGDVDRTFPTVAPLIESHYEPAPQILGGRLRVHASAVSLTREQSPLNTAQRLPGLDSSRATGELDWRRSFTSPAGLRLEPFVFARVDGYRVSDILSANQTSTTSRSTSRALGTAGADISYPLYKRSGDATLVMEPLAQIAVSPNARQIRVGTTATGAPVYLNEDSVAFEFDETTLFRANKFPGADLYEDGARLNVAGRGSVMWDDGRRASLLVGRTFRSESNDIFSERSGLRPKASDWIVAGDAQPMRGLSVFGRARLDSDTLDVRRLEAGGNINAKWGYGFVRYLRDNFDINGVKRENLDLGGEVRLLKNWGVSAYGNRDLNQNGWVIRDVGVFYSDECLRVDVVYRKEDTVLGRLGPNESVSVRLTLATLGGPIGTR